MRSGRTAGSVGRRADDALDRRRGTVAGTSWECAWTVSLANGQITVEGPFLDAGDSTLAITGGTGAYSKARGTMDLHARDAARSAYDFTYHVLG
jgi:hypothetical protein